MDMEKLKARAAEMADNWRKWECFSWSEPREGVWTLVYTHNRDSSLLNRVNAQVIDGEMSKFGEDAVPEDHSHFACGWVKGWAIRVYDEAGGVTEAFQAWERLCDKAEDHPVLDEDLYSAAECDALWDEVSQIVRRLANQKFNETPTDETVMQVIGILSLSYHEHRGPDEDKIEAVLVEKMGFTYEEVWNV
jgi:hypothetical protein